MGLIVEGQVLLSSDTFPQHGAPLWSLWLLAVRAGQPHGLWVYILQHKAVHRQSLGEWFFPYIAYAGKAE